jgi:hypothetical protein
MANRAKAKGSGGELEVCKMLTQWAKEEGFTLVAERNLEQVRPGGADISFTPDIGIEVEVKRCETLSLPAWWRQVSKAATDSGKVPILIYRQNRKPWKARMFVQVAHYFPNGGGFTHHMFGEFEMPGFEQWFKNHLKTTMGCN